MHILRAIVGFVMGLVVMGAIFVTGALDGVPHWWARNVTHRGDATYDPDPEHARYTVNAIYQPASNGGDNCEPEYQFVNHTNRVVKFLPDGYDDSAYGNSSPSNAVSLGPQQTNQGHAQNYNSQTYPPQNYSSQNQSQNYDRQNYGPQDGDQSDYQGRDTGGRDYDSDQYDNSGQSGGQYDDDDNYQSQDTQQGSCNPGVVQIILDKKK